MTSDSPRQPKFRRRAEARPDEVLDAALTLFAGQGFAATTVDQIAGQAGVSKGAVYLYFPSKAAILEGLVQRTIAPIAADTFDRMHGYRGDPRPLIAAFLRRIATTLMQGETRKIPVMILRESAATPQIAAMFRDSVLDQALPAVRALLEQGVQGGHIRAVDPELTTRTVVGPVMIHILLSEVFGIRPDDGLAMDRLIDNHLSIVLAGLAPDPDHPDTPR
ncbi:hypothetical protein GCM10011360_20530 [Primorskyibacter flagellatus]|uniref:HTH tetR-type domain-containing protein n=1 Tax=Primorskyibacter flagellatus TaxID=1387277 RepID=A0A917A8E1_9RHOB|nr:TetR/AcrR family transcriptional regulator [Primorskyibacter flagellatus]GGE32580.1 hypothetical protein GCM10011360_20530 [Primorskyibacter flagellatus]